MALAESIDTYEVSKYKQMGQIVFSLLRIFLPTFLSHDYWRACDYTKREANSVPPEIHRSWERSGGDLVMIVEILLGRMSPRTFSIVSICLLPLQFSERDHQYRVYRQVNTSGMSALPEILTVNSHVILSSGRLSWTNWGLLGLVLSSRIMSLARVKIKWPFWIVPP